VQALVAFGADASAANALGRTPADVAANNKHKLIAEYLAAVAGGRCAGPHGLRCIF
jgi:ankyrin repeat protein